jgi:hypothetical protein
MRPEISRCVDAAWIYFWIASLFVVAVALVNPPFMVADETNHFFRAAQISYGGFIGVKFPNGWAGGMLPQPVLNFGWAFGKMPFNQAVRTDIAQLAAVFPDTWRGTLAPVSFANTVIYPPQFYLPGAFALYVTRHFHMHLLQCFYIARIFSGLLCVLASALALRLCAPPARLWLLFCLCLPEILGLYASFSQDGPFIACTVLACALLTRGTGPQAAWNPLEMSTAISLLALFVSAKPPYLPVLFLPLVLVERRHFKFTLIAVLVALAAVFVWCVLGMRPLITPTRLGDISPARQLHNMLVHPGIIPVVLYNTFIVGGRWLIATCIATISWVDAGMPRWFYVMTFVLGLMLAGLYGLQFLKQGNRGAIPRLLLLFILVAGAGAGATLSTYLTWDEVGRDSVWGVLGRYFTPLLICLAPGGVFAAQGWFPQRAAPVISRVLLYGFLPFSGVSYLCVLFLRFWWPI